MKQTVCERDANGKQEENVMEEKKRKGKCRTAKLNKLLIILVEKLFESLQQVTQQLSY